MSDQTDIDIIKDNVSKLEEERDYLRHKLENLYAKHYLEVQEIRNLLTESESKVQTLSKDVHSLEQTHVNHTHNVNSLKKKADLQNSQLNFIKSELVNEEKKFGTLYKSNQEAKNNLFNIEAQLIDIELNDIKNRTIIHCSIRLQKNSDGLSDNKEDTKVEIEALNKKLARMYNERNKLVNNLNFKIAEICSLKQQLFLKNKKIIYMKTTRMNLKKQIFTIKMDISKLEGQLDFYRGEVKRLIITIKEIYTEQSHYSLDSRMLIGPDYFVSSSSSQESSQNNNSLETQENDLQETQEKDSQKTQEVV